MIQRAKMDKEDDKQNNKTADTIGTDTPTSQQSDSSGNQLEKANNNTQQ